MKEQLTLLVAILPVTLLLQEAADAQDWKMQPLQIQARWAASVSHSSGLPEYPRPRLVQRNCQNLNWFWVFVKSCG
jgi:hypothetical protein